MKLIVAAIIYLVVKAVNAIRGKPTTTDPQTEYAAELVAIFIFTAIFGAPAIMLFDAPHSTEGFIPTLFILIAFSFPLVEFYASTERYRASDPKTKTFWRRIQFLYVGLVVLMHVLIFTIAWRNGKK